jgi:multisubunit Na+/H+ antiporter MnhB subunit
VFAASVVFAIALVVYFLAIYDPENTTADKKREKSLLWSIVCTMVCLILGCVVASLFYQRNEEKNKLRG